MASLLSVSKVGEGLGRWVGLGTGTVTLYVDHQING